MPMDPAIKLFGKTIALPLSSDEGCVDYDKAFPKNREQESPNSEQKGERATSTTNDTPEPEKDSTNTEENQNDSSDQQDKPQLKKPDKILPCPRCKSMDTKFCYYNNYNVNQPRHFCKNCQRYWTAGGTMRNVPVGAGRRKNKNSTSSHFRHFTVSDATLKPNGSTVLSFGSDAPLCDPMTSVINLAESKEQTNVDTAPHFAYVNGGSTPWAYPLPPPPPPPIMYNGHAYWGYMPWISPMVVASSFGMPSIPEAVSPLGKHSREGDSSDTTCVRKGNVWIPKTLRIDDPEEAAKSSIWATMGFNNDKSDRGLFKPFPKKCAELDSHSKVDASSQLFRANPAALSRSINFQENT